MTVMIVFVPIWAVLSYAVPQVIAVAVAPNITGGVVIPLSYQSVNVSSSIRNMTYSSNTIYSANSTAGAGRRLQQVTIIESEIDNTIYFGTIQLGTTGSKCDVVFDTGSSDIVLTNDNTGGPLTPSGNFQFLNIKNFVLAAFGGGGVVGGIVLSDDVELVPGVTTTTLTDQAFIAAGKSSLPGNFGIFGLSFGSFSVAMTNPGFQNGISRAVLPLTDLSTVTNGGNFKATPQIGYSAGPITTLANLPLPFQPVGNPLFSFNLLSTTTVSTTPAAGGSLILGGYDKTKFTEDIYCSNVDTGVGWGISLDGFLFINSDGTPSSVAKTCVAPEKCVAIVDSGTTGIVVPSSIFPKIQALIGATNTPKAPNTFTIDCSVLGTGKLPTLQLRIGGHIYTVTEKNYIQQVTPGVCVSRIQQFGASFDKTSGAGNSNSRSQYILGLVFMRTLPTIFDASLFAERICFGADPPLPSIVKIANVIFTPSTTSPGQVTFDISNDFDPTVAFKLTAGTVTFHLGAVTSTVQLASALQNTNSATAGIISYTVPAPVYGAFTVIIDFTPAAGFIKDVDTVPATLHIANQGSSAINTITAPKSWNMLTKTQPIDGTITFTAPVNPTVAASPALGPVNTPLLTFPIDGTVSITVSSSTLGSVHVSCLTASCPFHVPSQKDIASSILHEDVTVTFVPTNTVTAGPTDFGPSTLAPVATATLVYPA